MHERLLEALDRLNSQAAAAAIVGAGRHVERRQHLLHALHVELPIAPAQPDRTM
jgi:hypothetical protein